jgi:hypothetical protein
MANDTQQHGVGEYRGIDFALLAAIFALMGAFFWAIRGTGGYGGSMGGILAGLGWAMLWFGFSRHGGMPRQRPYGTGHMVAAITLGIAFGGMTGYGVYIGWLRGDFYLDYPEGARAIAPWTGFAMLFFCGLHWGGVTGAFMAWCAPAQPVTRHTWPGRIFGGVAGAVVAALIVRAFPQFFLPFYGEGIYQNPDNATCIRAVGSIRNIAPHVGAYFGFLAAEIVRRDKRAVGMMLVMGLGFAIPFTVGGIWQTYQGSGIDMPWWKFWEMSIGFGGGLAFALAFYLFNRPSLEVPRPVTRNERVWPVAVIISIAATLVVTNAYEGFTRLHGFEWPGAVRLALTLACFLAIGGAFVAWLRAPRKECDEPVLPGWAPAAVLALIVAAGYLVSVPGALHWHNKVLLTLYSIFIPVSVAAFVLLALRRKAA